MKLQKAILFLSMLLFCSFNIHKYYLSLTEINYKEESKSVQIIINVFMDDIELALNKDYNIDLQLTTKKELENNDIYFSKYLKEKLIFEINNQQKNYTYLGKEYEGDLVFFYLEIEDVEKFKNLNITNNILTTHFPEQQNLVKCNVQKNYKSQLLTKDNNKAKFTY